MIRTYRTCNTIARLSKYEFYNKLLGGDKPQTEWPIMIEIN